MNRIKTTLCSLAAVFVTQACLAQTPYVQAMEVKGDTADLGLSSLDDKGIAEQELLAARDNWDALTPEQQLLLTPEVPDIIAPISPAYPVGGTATESYLLGVLAHNDGVEKAVKGEDEEAKLLDANGDPINELDIKWIAVKTIYTNAGLLFADAGGYFSETIEDVDLANQAIAELLNEE